MEVLVFNNSEEIFWCGEGYEGLFYYFMLYKQLMIFGFFMLEVGVIQVLCFVEVLGDYRDIFYKKGDKVWMMVWLL